MKKYEYKTAKSVSYTKDLDGVIRLSEVGWEFFTIIKYDTIYDTFSVLYFKRELLDS
jgi:hypothetical protein